MVALNHTVRVLGRDVRVPITYEKEGSYFVLHAPDYKVRTSRLSQREAWKDFSEKLAVAVEHAIKARS